MNIQKQDIKKPNPQQQPQKGPASTPNKQNPNDKRNQPNPQKRK